MTDDLDNSAPFDDDQGTRIPKKPTGAGAEPTRSTDEHRQDRTPDHESGYGGKGGEPKESNEIPTSRR